MNSSGLGIHSPRTPSQRPSRTPLTSFSPEGPFTLPPAPGFTKNLEDGWIFGSHPEASPGCYRRFQAMLFARRSTCFAYSLKELPGYNGFLGPMRITVKPGFEDKMFSPPRKYSPLEEDIRKEKTDELKDAGFVRRAPPSRVASCPVMPGKKDLDGNYTDRRFCIDIRRVNKGTELDKYGIPPPEALFQKAGKGKWFSKIDLRGAFHQIPIHPDDQYLTSFWIGHELWCYTRTVYGLASAPSGLQRLLDTHISVAGLSDVAAAFLDDILMWSDTEAEHLVHVAAVLDMLNSIGLRAHPDKCIIACEALEYLGFLLGSGYLAPHQSKIQAIRDLKTPTNVKQLQAVLGLCNYYRQLLPDYSIIAHDLHTLTRLNTPWVWTPHHEEVFQQLKDLLCEEGRILRTFDRDSDTIVYTDWSSYGMGAVLAQIDPISGQEHMVACISRSLNKHEANYGAYAGELSSAVWAIRSFRHYLHGTQFKLITDHQPLKWLLTTPDLVGKPARWMLMIQEFTFEVLHRPGVDNVNADVLSRYPLPTTYDPTGTQFDVDTDQLQVESEALGAHLRQLHLSTPVAKRRKATPAANSEMHVALMTASQAQVPSVVPTPANPATMLCSVLAVQRVLAGSQSSAFSQPCVAKFMDTFAPPRANASCETWLPDDWWDPNNGDSAEPDDTDRSSLQWWAAQARTAVCAAAFPISSTPQPSSQPLLLGDPLPDCDWKLASQICNTPVGSAFYSEAASSGLVVVELFGGLCAGLEMVLSCGFSVSQYFYCDVNPTARLLASHRMAILSTRFPGQLPATAFEDTLFALPQDVQDISTQHIHAIVTLQPASKWLLVAGWPCEDLSAAGKGLGLAGPRSRLFFDAVRILGLLQQMLPSLPAHLLENTYMLWGHSSPHVRNVAYPQIVKILGPCTHIDAAQFGSGAYRLRSWWTNLQSHKHLHMVVECWQRPANLLVQPLLDPTHKLLPTTGRQQQPPNYPCNRVQGQVEALPTLVSFPNSNNYRGTKPGVIYDTSTHSNTEPNATERERLLGYLAGTTAAPDITEAQRFQLTGQCMDANTLKGIFSICLALNDLLPSLLPSSANFVSSITAPQLKPLKPAEWDRWYSPLSQRLMRQQGWKPGLRVGHQGSLLYPICPPVNRTPDAGLGFSDTPSTSAAAYSAMQQGGYDSGVSISPSYFALPTLAPPAYQEQQETCQQLADAEESRYCLATSGQQPTVPQDPLSQPQITLPTEVILPNEPVDPATSSGAEIWEDYYSLHFLKFGRHKPGLTPKEKQRIWKRLKAFRILDGGLQRCLANGSWKLVPPPNLRTDIILQCHRSTGHWGIRRTHYMVGLQYWWYDMWTDIQRVLRTCEECSRVKASFSSPPPTLQPLEITGLFARWSVDLAGPLPLTRRGNRFIMVMIDGFSKQIEVVPLPDKSAASTTYAFVREVLCRYGACAEVVTDQGSEFQNEFHQMLRSAFIDHRTTSANHPSANGQAERTVQSMKRALEKYAALSVAAETSWDEYLPYVVLGYRVSVQASLGFSPYELLHGTKALLPSPIRYQFSEHLTLENPLSRQQPICFRGQRHCAVSAP